MANAALAEKTVPLDAIDVSDPAHYQNDTWQPLFARLRAEDPVHYCRASAYGPYWSVTRYNDIMTVELDHQAYSSEHGGIQIIDTPESMKLPNFIRMDPPRHTVQRKTVAPVATPAALANFEVTIRQRTGAVLDALPRNEAFDWVDKVSIELTTMMLATLFDFPFEERRKLTRWSDVTTANPGHGIVDTWEQKIQELMEFQAYFVRLWNERVNATESKGDLISMLAHNPATRNMPPREYLGNLILLIVGGNDTTRNSMTGGLYWLNQFPGEYDKLRANPSLIPNMVSEIIRYQTPLAYMRRTALQDFEVQGKTIRKGDKLAMWYVSGNRDSAHFEEPDRFMVDRKNVRSHIAFGYGIHRCVGNRLGELQLKILWEELLKRYPRIDVVSEPVRVPSSFVNGYLSMQVKIPA
jgi:cytochrome P450